MTQTYYLVDVRSKRGTPSHEYAWVCVSERQAHFTALRYIREMGERSTLSYKITRTDSRPGTPVHESDFSFA